MNGIFILTAIMFGKLIKITAYHSRISINSLTKHSMHQSMTLFSRKDPFRDISRNTTMNKASMEAVSYLQRQLLSESLGWDSKGQGKVKVKNTQTKVTVDTIGLKSVAEDILRILEVIVMSSHHMYMK